MTEHGPTVRHRRLATELRGLRERANLTPEQAAGGLGWSRAKLVKIEKATRRPAVGDVAAILELYGGTDEALRLALLELARNVRQRGWWAAYGDVLSGSYAELEDDASEIRSYQPHFVPGLLQTPDYARELIASRGFGPDETDRRLEARMKRQTLLERSAAPQLTVMLEEAVLRRPVGGTDVMGAQLQALASATRRPNVSVRVIPLSVALHPGTGGPFVVFGFAEAVSSAVVYFETLAGGLYLEEVEQVRRTKVMYDRMAAEAALSEEESSALIRAIAQGE